MSVQPMYGGQQVAFGTQQPVMMMQQQPVQMAPVVMQQPQQGDKKLLCSREGHRTWSSDLLDCFDSNTSCVFTWLCPIFTMVEVSHRVGEHTCVGCCCPGGMVALRSRLRTMGGIKGSVCGDYLTYCFCGLCALSQMERELYHMGL